LADCFAPLDTLLLDRMPPTRHFATMMRGEGNSDVVSLNVAPNIRASFAS